MEVEGYGYLSNVIGKVNDAPMFWLPYLVIPLKSKRQSGLLFPRFGLSNLGFNFVQPIFFALSRSTDMTLGLGHYGGRGRRVEWEGRYALERGSALAQVFYQRDKTFGEYLEGQRLNLGNSTERWGLNLQQNHEFPFGIRQKLRLLEVSDNLYPSNLNDVPGFGEAFIASDLSLSHATNQVSTYGYVRRHRNLIHSAPDPRSFDDDTVQVFPHAVLTTNDRFLFGSSVAGGLTLGLTNFTRGGGPFDRDQTGGPVDDGTPFRLGQDPLRESLRLSLKPTLYTTLRPFDVVQWVPSLRYHQYFYSFPGGVESLSRGYLQFTNDLSTQLERIYEFEDPGTPKMKHLIRPMLRYSLIPAISEPRHPFMQQMQFARDNDYTGYNFDNEDLVPIDPPRNNSNYFMPQGNAIEYGFSTQLIRKRNSQILRERMLQEDRENPGRQNLMIPQALPGAGFQGASYQRSLEWQGGQSFNFRELRQTGRPQQPLSRLYSRMLAEYDQWSGGIDYFYIPYQPITASTNRHIFTTSGTYFFERSLRQGVLDFERSMNFTYGFNRSSTTSQTHNLRTQVTWSLSDYVMPSVAFAYDLLSRLPQTLTTRLSFQSPSECWRLMLTMNQTQCQLITPNLSGWCSNFNIDLAMNWAGRGFGGLGAP
jgi:lipopolysaccharide assembly outer membrane protein LptD (OstA)